jgi:hypothetical protein
MPISGSLKYGTRWHYGVAVSVSPPFLFCFSRIPNLGGCPIKPLCFLDRQKKITFFLVFLSKRSVCFLLQQNNALRVQVISLCGWSRRWVQAGNVFSCTTLAIMWLQYLARGMVEIVWVASGESNVAMQNHLQVVVLHVS